MNGVFTAAAAQVHFWPWSVEISAQTKNLTTGNVSFPFFGSPVISLRAGSCHYFSPPGLSVSHHSVLRIIHQTRLARSMKLRMGFWLGQRTYRTLRLRTSSGSQQIGFTAQGATERFEPSPGADAAESIVIIARYVLAWSQVFDELLEKAHTTGSLSNAIILADGA